MVTIALDDLHRINTDARITKYTTEENLRLKARIGELEEELKKYKTEQGKI